MNIEYKPTLIPLKVFFVNPLAPASQLAIVKIMSGIVFGNDQLIDLTLVVYSNEIKSAEAFGLEVESCAFSCTGSIKVSSELPCVSDGDVFCYLSNFKNPNSFNFGEESLDDEFDALYLTIKLANNLRWIDNKETMALESIKKAHFENKDTKKEKVSKEETRPIFITDGWVSTDIIKTFSTNLPNNIFFYPSPITAIAKSVLSAYLNVPCKAINEILVWAANDEVFYVEVEKPLIIDDTVELKSKCDWDMVGEDLLKTFNLDLTQLSASWMRKEFIEKVAANAEKNPYGCIYKAMVFTKTLRDVWSTRTHDDGTEVYRNIGCVSDGSVGTIKGYPYVLPVIFKSKGFWVVNNAFEDNTRLKQEIRRMNNTVKQIHERLIPYCKKFLQENIINRSCAEDNSGTICF